MTRETSEPATRPPGALPLGLAAAVLVLVLDQVSKWWIIETVMRPPRVIPLTPFFNLVMGWNRGISFGLFNTDSPYNAWLLSAIALIIVAVLVVWIGRAEDRLTALLLGTIVGGALGIVADRMVHGAVADFLDVHLAGYHWPAFNVADSGISVAVVALLAKSLFAGRPGPKIDS